MSIHDDVTLNMKEMAEKFAKLGLNLELPPASSFLYRRIAIE